LPTGIGLLQGNITEQLVFAFFRFSRLFKTSFRALALQLHTPFAIAKEGMAVMWQIGFQGKNIKTVTPLVIAVTKSPKCIF
jgi:hypothetical protein